MRVLSSIVACTISVMGLSAAPVSFIDLFGTQVFTQTSDGSAAATGAFLGTHVYFQAGDFTSATFTPPGGIATNMPVSSSTTFYFGSTSFADLAAMDAAYAPGVYAYDSAGPGGNPNAPSNVTVTRPANAYGTSTPYLTNFSSLANMNPALGLLVNWDAFTGGLNPTNDPKVPDAYSYVFFTITRDSDNAIVYDAGFLPGATASTFLAANTLAGNTAYTFNLVFSNRMIGTTTSGTTDFPPTYGFDLRTLGSFTTGPMTATPEPASMGMVLSGLVLIALRRRK
ncbi:PEP-CTERM sorting domain-containing protein [Paludibaculum fermentans]|uniref:PEP-CTERM sorting domain-containing protein n=1 Tax=Paludibaculum fermentans TaxID=1473598 RepID=UPI003EC039CE